ncbi:hypothetical protein [Aureimonas ureilytica]|uniref:hypothetical protein n=1 Tax=Aureimonas ureilytica TaxID=401562 RepID=UPI000AAEAE4D|nr:hypothetical protein [Aureimonas ureilytica]
MAVHDIGEHGLSDRRGYRDVIDIRNTKRHINGSHGAGRVYRMADLKLTRRHTESL